MQKKLLFLLVPFILGCNYLFPPGETPPVEIPQPVEETAAPTEDSALLPQVEESPALPTESVPQAAFVAARIHKRDGSFDSQLEAKMREAEDLGLTPFIEFDATWCPACVAITKSLESEDAITVQAFAGTYVVRADVDEWGAGDSRKFDFDGIPIFFKLDYEGNPTGDVIDGGAWGENIPENFAPVLDEFFHAP